MKLIGIILSCTLFLSTLSLAQDDTVSTVRELSVGGGVVIPILPDDFSDYWKPGMNATVGYGLVLAPGPIGYGTLYATVQYFQFPFDEDGFREALKSTSNLSEINGGSRSIVTATLNFKGTFSTERRTIAPYFLLGAGYHYNTSVEISYKVGNVGRVIKRNAKSAFTWLSGLGLDIPVSEQFTLFLEGKYTFALVSEPAMQHVPVTAGLRMTL